MFKRILVAVDGSPASNAGLNSAVRLAKDQKATLVALHVADDSLVSLNFEGRHFPPRYIDAYCEVMQKDGRKLLAKTQAAARSSGVKIDTVLARGHRHTVAHVIVQQARELKADVIVLGTHGRRGLTRLLMGSDAEAVVREAGVPVLLVREPPKKASRKSSASVKPIASAKKRPMLKRAEPLQAH